jgi:hypothetical protein
VRAAVGTMVGGPWAGGSPGRGCSTRWLICGTGYWVVRATTNYTACIAGQIRQAQRSRARTVELTCSERWARRGQAAWAGQDSSTGLWLVLIFGVLAVMRAAEGHNNAADRTGAVSSHTRAEGRIHGASVTSLSTGCSSDALRCTSTTLSSWQIHRVRQEKSPGEVTWRATARS